MEKKGEMKAVLTRASGWSRLRLVETKLCANSRCGERIISCPKCGWQGEVCDNCPGCGIPLQGYSNVILISKKRR
jgi:hypothetical protein